MPPSNPKVGAGSNETTFRAYSPDQAIAIIRTIAEHRWPISLEEAFALRDQFGWTPAPDDGRFFVTPVSNGEEDGSISLDRKNGNCISRIGFNLTTQFSDDADPESYSLLKTTYSAYVDGLTSLYGVGEVSFGKKSETVIWYLPSRASVDIGITRKFISAAIESPAMTALTEAEERYFAEGGEL